MGDGDGVGNGAGVGSGAGVGVGLGVGLGVGVGGSWFGVTSADARRIAPRAKAEVESMKAAAIMAGIIERRGFLVCIRSFS